LIEQKTQEYEQQHQQQIRLLAVGPSIYAIHNDGDDDNNWQRTEGDDHRQLLQTLLFHSCSDNSDHNNNNKKTCKKKRKRKIDDTVANDSHNAGCSTTSQLLATSTSSPPPPSWARIHNPALLDGVAVVEFAIDENDEDDVLFQMPSSRMSNTNNNDANATNNNTSTADFISSLLSTDPKKNCKEEEKKENLVVLPLMVELFQGDRPRHITDVVMYEPPKPPPKNNHKNVMKTMMDQNNHNDISKYQAALVVSQLKDLCATPSVMKKNLFPILSSHHSSTPKSDDVDAATPKKLLYDMAQKHYLQQQQTTIDWKKDTCTLFDDIQKSKNHTDNVFMIPINDNKDASSLIPYFSVPIASSENNNNIHISNAKDDTHPVEPTNSNDNNTHSQHYIQTYFSNKDFISDPKKPFLEKDNDDSTITLEEQQPRIFALDCEMVGTSAGVELARVTLIQYCHPEVKEEEGMKYRYRVVMDALVKPHLVVLDYVTAYSGVTATMLEHVTTRIEDIQTMLLCTIYKEDIIIGHSLDNDMRALRWIHPHIVDTSLILPHPCSSHEQGNKKYSLRHLSAVLLKKQIQQHNNNSKQMGHCSIEDAAAALYLALQRAELGSSFGIKNKRNNRTNIFQQISKRQKSLRQRQQAHLLSTKNNELKEGDDLVSRHFQRPLVCLGPAEWIEDHILSFQNAAHALSCEDMFASSVKALYSWLNYNNNKNKRRSFFLWSKLSFHNENNNVNHQDNKNKKRKNNSNEESLNNVNQRIDEIMVRLLYFIRQCVFICHVQSHSFIFIYIYVS